MGRRKHRSRQGEAQCAREVGREGVLDTTQGQNSTLLDAAAGGAESRGAGGCHRQNVKGKSWHCLTCEGRTSSLQHEEEYSLNCLQKTTRQVMRLLQYSLYGMRDAAQC